MMSHYHSRKISGTQQSFLTEMAIGNVERWKKSMGYYFVSECNHALESHTRQFFLFFSVILARPKFVEIQKICHYGNVTYRILLSISAQYNALVTWLPKGKS